MKLSNLKLFCTVVFLINLTTRLVSSETDIGKTETSLLSFTNSNHTNNDSVDTENVTQYIKEKNNNNTFDLPNIPVATLNNSKANRNQTYTNKNNKDVITITIKRKNKNKTKKKGRKHQLSASGKKVASLNENLPKVRNKKRCGKNNGGCSQKCLTKGKKKCDCFDGYTLAKNRKLCIDTNECEFANGGCEETCVNTLGGHICSCSTGLRISDNQKTCQDINECLLRNGHGPCQEICTNIVGSYVCSCTNGTALSHDLHTCEDIDECIQNTSGCSHDCINAHGRFYCTCPEGMHLISDGRTCQDIDECNSNDEIMKVCNNSKCVNTIGSYYCELDVQNDQIIDDGTKTRVCPILDPPSDGFIMCNRNDEKSYDTFTKTGRRTIRNKPGTKCEIQCRIGFKVIGTNMIQCDLNGSWIGGDKSYCQKY